MRIQDIEQAAEKAYPRSYDGEWELKQTVFIEGVSWAIDNSEVGDLKQEIRELKDKIYDLEYDHDETIDKLREEISEYKQTIRELNRQIKE